MPQAPRALEAFLGVAILSLAPIACSIIRLFDGSAPAPGSSDLNFYSADMEQNRRLSSPPGLSKPQSRCVRIARPADLFRLFPCAYERVICGG